MSVENSVFCPRKYKINSICIFNISLGFFPFFFWFPLVDFSRWILIENPPDGIHLQFLLKQLPRKSTWQNPTRFPEIFSSWSTGQSEFTERETSPKKIWNFYFAESSVINMFPIMFFLPCSTLHFPFNYRHEHMPKT